MKQIMLIFTLSFSLLFLEAPSTTAQSNELETVIIEVKGDMKEHQEYLNTHHPFIEIIQTYTTLFQGFALQGKPEHFKRMEQADFIKGIHENITYQATPAQTIGATSPDRAPLPTTYTGKGIDVAVIDTGIDYTHSDLEQNYKGGYDVFDLDEDPMETLPEEGMPTNHGSHVAGIIGANGKLQGVAKETSLHAYRSLGPGGFGTTLHVLAALEQAVHDQVDIINLSLGNQVNGPDYPTSIAVNNAVELGIPVVIANGNSGPNPWTVGSPATAKDALSVGALQDPTSLPYLYHPQEGKELHLTPMQGAPSWELEKDQKIIHADKFPDQLNGSIALFTRGEVSFQEQAIQAQENGAVAVLIANNEPGILQGAVDPDSELEIPVAGLLQEEGEWLKKHSGDYIDTKYQMLDTTVADFSSRGPVTVDWRIKPDLIAPGTDINSTVPGGYEQFSGTSMAAPYVAGSLALVKEAHPNWDVEKLYSALQTTAEALHSEEGDLYAPSIQGHGVIQPNQAIETPTIIYNKSLEAGKITNRNETKQFTINIENRSDEKQSFTFDIPKKSPGTDWNLPLPFSVQPGEVKEVAIDLEVASSKLEDGVHEGYLPIIEQTTNETYYLPYLFINQSADQPKIAGLEFSLKAFSTDTYRYNIYTTEALEMITIDLYDPDTLTYRGNLLELEQPEIGANDGEIPSYQLTPGIYMGIVTAINQEGEMETEEIPIHIE